MAGKRKNYFSDNIQKNGENFLQQYDAKKLRGDARRVIMDIAFGNIDFDEYGVYFSDSQFINALIDVVYTKLTIHRISYNGVECMSRECTNNDIENIKRYHRRLVEAYQLFYDYFMAIEASGFSGESIAQLKVLSTRARDYAQDLIEPIFSNPSGGVTAAYTSPAIQNMCSAPQYIPTVTDKPPVIEQSQIRPLNMEWLMSDAAKAKLK